jgi:hypothetical protein
MKVTEAVTLACREQKKFVDNIWNILLPAGLTRRCSGNPKKAFNGATTEEEQKTFGIANGEIELFSRNQLLQTLGMMKILGV